MERVSGCCCANLIFDDDPDSGIAMCARCKEWCDVVVLDDDGNEIIKENKYMKDNEASKIRAELKQHGITSKQVSVRQSPCTYSQSIDCRIKDFCIDPEFIESIANKYSDFRYCEASGEILSGGNMYVSVSYDWERERDLKSSDDFKKFQIEIDAKLSQLEGNRGIEISPGYTVFKGQCNGYQASIKWHNSPWKSFHSSQDVAFDLYLSRLQGKGNG